MTFSPVLPESDILALQRYTLEKQAKAMVFGSACSKCATGIRAEGDMCARCEQRDRLTNYVTEFRAAMRERVDAARRARGELP